MIQSFLSISSTVVIRVISELILLIILYAFRLRNKKVNLLTLHKEVEEFLIEDFEPLKIKNYQIILEPKASKIEDKSKGELTKSRYDDCDILAYRSSNKSQVVETLNSYGVGTCGPPGFYGTLDLHAQLETEIATNVKQEAAIVYSNAYACMNSVINCFVKKNDNIFYNDMCNESIVRGLSITKASTIEYSDDTDLEDKLDIYALPRYRNFIIEEGLYKNTGVITDLPKLYSLKDRYKTRLILDESNSFPLLNHAGCSGYYGLNNSTDITVGSLSGVLCSNGGFSAGNREIVDYQRLCSQSYCFSASMPGFLVVNASTNIEKNIDEDYINKLIRCFHQQFRSVLSRITSSSCSPIIIITSEYFTEPCVLKIIEKLHDCNVCVLSGIYPVVGLKLYIQTSITIDEIIADCMSISSCIDEVIGEYLP